MSIQINLPNAPEGDTIVSGITFTDGTADVASLGDHRRAFFEHYGATIIDTTIEIPESREAVADLTVEQLRRIAGSREIAVASKAKHDELVAVIGAALFPEQG